MKQHSIDHRVDSASLRPREPILARVSEPGSGRVKQLLEWSDTLSVGVATIDEQHKGLVAMLNEINEGIQGGWGRKARDEVLAKLVEYTVIHFATEESLMKIAGYPEEAAHIRRHENLIQMVEQYITKYNEDPSASNYDLLFFLRRWLVEHIQKDDKLLGQYLVQRGVVGDAQTSKPFFTRIKEWLGKISFMQSR